MAQPTIATPQIVALSANNLAEAPRQLKAIMPFKGDPETLHTFVSRVDYVTSLYQINYVRQPRILLGVIERNLDGPVIRSLGLPNMEDWSTLQSRHIAEFKTLTSNQPTPTNLCGRYLIISDTANERTTNYSKKIRSQNIPTKPKILKPHIVPSTTTTLYI